MVRRVFVFLLVGVPAALAAGQDMPEDVLLVDIWLSDRGDVSLNVTRDTPPPGADRIQDALAQFIGADALHVSTDVYELREDGTYQPSETQTQWQVSAYTERDLPFQWTYELRLDPQPLLDALEDAELAAVDLFVTGFRTPLLDTSGALDATTSGDIVSAASRYAAGETVEPVVLRYGYPRDWVATRALLMLLVLLMPGVAALWLRRAAAGVSDEEAGYACMITTRRYQRLVWLFWFLWIGLILASDPIRFFAFYWSHSAWVWRFSTWTVAPFLFLALPAMLPAKPLLFPVYARFPGASWRPKDFFFQGLWFNLIILAFAVVVDTFIRSAAAGDILAAVSWTLAGLLAVVFFYLQYLSSLGFVPQSVDEGALRDRIDELARRAGLERIKDVNVVYFTKAPMPNAFAANGLRIMVTDYLLKTLSKREVDAILAHELGHLRAKHPQKLMRTLILTVTVAVVAALLIYSDGLVPLVAYGLTERALLAAFALALPAGLLARYALSRRYEREADLAAVEITGDPEAFITGLARITRLSYMPLTTGRWNERFSTHPSTQRRIDRIAAHNNLSRERVAELLESDVAGADRYELPPSAELNRVFSSRYKTRVALTIMLASLLIAVGVPWLAFYLTLEMEPAPALVASIAGIVAAVALVVYENVASLAGFRRMRRALAARLDVDPDAGWRFVGFSPNPGALLYDGFTNWDIGFVRTHDGQLEYAGDATSFAIPAQHIRAVDCVRRRQARWLAANRVHVVWKVDDADPPRTFVFEAADARSLWGANRATTALHEALSAWHTTHPASGDADRLPPRFDVRGRPLHELVSARRYAVGVIVVGLLAFLIAQTLPSASPPAAFSLQIWTGLSAAAAFALANLPQAVVRPRQEDMPPPFPDNDPFERSNA